MVPVLAEGRAGEARARPWEEVQVEMMIGSVRVASFDVPARFLASTDVTFQGRTVSGDRQTVSLQGTGVPTGFRDPAGVVLGATQIPLGTSMI